MKDNIIMPKTKDKTGRLTFFIFEIAAVSLAFFIFIAAIVMAALTRTFMAFFEYFMIAIGVCLFIYALGRLIDLSYVKAESKCDCGPDCDCNKEEKE